MSNLLAIFKYFVSATANAIYVVILILEYVQYIIGAFVICVVKNKNKSILHALDKNNTNLRATLFLCLYIFTNVPKVQGSKTTQDRVLLNELCENKCKYYLLLYVGCEHYLDMEDWYILTFYKGSILGKSWVEISSYSWNMKVMSLVRHHELDMASLSCNIWIDKTKEWNASEHIQWK